MTDAYGICRHCGTIGYLGNNEKTKICPYCSNLKLQGTAHFIERRDGVHYSKLQAERAEIAAKMWRPKT